MRFHRSATLVLALVAALLWAGAAPAQAHFELLRRRVKSYSSPATFPADSTNFRRDRGANRLRLPAPGAVALTVEAGPAERMMSFRIRGMTNPEIEIPVGTRLTLHVINVDTDMSHDFFLTAQAPPYARQVAAGKVGVARLKAHQDGSYSGADLEIRATSAGRAYYLCTVPGHARAGMWGRITVR